MTRNTTVFCKACGEPFEVSLFTLSATCTSCTEAMLRKFIAQPTLASLYKAGKEAGLITPVHAYA